MVERADESHVALLEKELVLQRAAGARREATETALRLSEAVSDRRDRATRRREAAALLAEQGDHARAAEVLERALADNPLDEQALGQVVDAYGGCGRSADVETLLERVLPELPVVGDRPAARTRRADLWQRLGEARRQRDPAGAIAALERAVEADPERVEARLALTTLYQGAPSTPRRRPATTACWCSPTSPARRPCARWPPPTLRRGASTAPAAASSCSTCWAAPTRTTAPSWPPTRPRCSSPRTPTPR